VNSGQWMARGSHPGAPSSGRCVRRVVICACWATTNCSPCICLADCWRCRFYNCGVQPGCWLDGDGEDQCLGLPNRQLPCAVFESEADGLVATTTKQYAKNKKLRIGARPHLLAYFRFRTLLAQPPIGTWPVRTFGAHHSEMTRPESVLKMDPRPAFTNSCRTARC
jgi:hypothetical protein